MEEIDLQTLHKKPLIVYLDRLTQESHKYLKAFTRYFTVRSFHSLPEAVAFIMSHRRDISLVIIEPYIANNGVFEKKMSSDGKFGGLPLINMLNHFFPSLTVAILTHVAEGETFKELIDNKRIPILLKSDFKPPQIIERIKEIIPRSANKAKIKVH